MWLQLPGLFPEKMSRYFCVVDFQRRECRADFERF